MKFRRQHPIGSFIVDFYAAAMGLVVEVDGAVHRTEGGAARDRRRDECLTRLGLRVVHVDAERVECDLHAVAQELQALIAQSTVA